MLTLSQFTPWQMSAATGALGHLPDNAKALIASHYPGMQEDLNRLKEAYESQITKGGYFLTEEPGAGFRRIVDVFDQAIFRNQMTFNEKHILPIEQHEEIQSFMQRHGYKDFGEAEEFYKKMKGIKEAALETYHGQVREVLEKAIDAQKKLFAVPESRQVLMAAYNADLVDGNKRWGWFTDAVKNSKTVPELMIEHMSSPELFVRALEGSGDSHGLNRMIRQAKTLSIIEGKPLAETMADRLRVAGLTEFQTEVFSKLAEAYERGEHVQALATIESEFGAAAKLLSEEREVAWKAALESSRTADAAVDVGKKGASDASRSGQVLEEGVEATKTGESVLGMIGRNKLAFGIGAAVVVGAIGLGLWSMRGKTDKTSQQQVAQR